MNINDLNNNNQMNSQRYQKHIERLPSVTSDSENEKYEINTHI